LAVTCKQFTSQIATYVIGSGEEIDVEEAYKDLHGAGTTLRQGVVQLIEEGRCVLRVTLERNN
jgi:hypothetical protein